MAMDLKVTAYDTFEDLRGYMYGSAAVIGLQMVPILEPLTPQAHDRARALGEAFQLTNFIRDEVERAGYDVLSERVSVPLPRRLTVALPGMARAALARREAASWNPLPP